MTTTIAIMHPGDGSWGSDKVLLQTAEVLAEGRDVELHLWVQEPAIDPAFAAAFPGTMTRVRTLVARRRELKSWRVWRLVFWPVFVLLDLWRMRNVDEVFINTCVPLSALLAAGIGRKRGWVHVHEIPHGRFEQQLFSRVVIASGLSPIYISEATRRAFQSAVGRRPSPALDGPIVHNGLPVPDAAPPIQPDAGEPLRILCVGRFAPWKGQAVLLQALAELDRRAVAYAVRIVGYDENADPAFIKTLRDQAVALAGSVEFLPYQDSVESLYAWTHVVVVPSLQPEPFGLAAIEAGMRSRAVIGSAHGGLVEIIDDGRTGRLVAPNDPTALADALETYASHPDEMVKAGEQARETYPERFGADAFARRMGEALQ